MIPILQLRRAYEEYPQPRTIEEDIEAHLISGYVVSTPEAFIMGRGIARDADEALISNPYYRFPREQQDCWLVFAFAGQSRNFLMFLPYPLRWLAWQRRGGPLRFYEFEKFKAKCAHTTLF